MGQVQTDLEKICGSKALWFLALLEFDYLWNAVRSLHALLDNSRHHHLL